MSSDGLFAGIEIVKSIGGVGLDEVAKAESDLDVTFSDEYKDYLIEYGEATCLGHELTGICSNNRLNVVDVTEDAKQNGYHVPDGYYAIEDIHIDSMVFFQNAKGEIYSIQPGNEPIFQYESLRDYLSSTV